ncbi:MAG: outer membrane protein assembly factor BamC [Pseudohongiellaceae bacterium]
MLNKFPIPGMDYIAGEEGLLRDRQADYLDAEVLPRTQIPSAYDSYIIDDLMVIPEVSQENTQEFLRAPRPRGFSGRMERGVVIQRMNEESWIVVDVSPSEVWPRIRDYWSTKSIGVDFENPTGGIMDTGWFVLEGNALTKEKMRVMIEPGFQNNSAEIRLLHQSANQAIPTIGRVDWPDESMDEGVAYDFLTDLSGYLADLAGLYQASTVSFLAENISSRGKASMITTPGGRDILRLEADYNRSWASVSRALQRAEVDIVADSQEQGIIEVDYIIRSEDENDKPGLFRRVVTLNGIFSESDPGQYFPLRIRVVDLNGEVEVLIESQDAATGTEEEQREAENSLLRLIRNYLA